MKRRPRVEKYGQKDGIYECAKVELQKHIGISEHKSISSQHESRIDPIYFIITYSLDICLCNHQNHASFESLDLQTTSISAT